MTASRTYLAAIHVALLMLPCAALSQQAVQSAPPSSGQQVTQNPAPVVRHSVPARTGNEQTAPVQTGVVPIRPKYLNGPAPLVKQSSQSVVSPGQPATGNRATYTASPRTAQTSSQGESGARAPSALALPGSSSARSNPSASAGQNVASGGTSSSVTTTPKPHTYLPRPTGPLVPSATGPFNRTTVFIDPAHGGNDVGSRITDSILEKDVALQLAFRLRSLLAARGFTVDLSREDDSSTVINSPSTPLSLDARAGIANHARPVACLLIHATGSGRGVHLYSSELAPTPGEPNGTPWLTAQAPWVMQSWKLSQQIGQALAHTNIPLVQNRASIRPVDSLTCPALVVELAPDTNDVTSLNNGSYQQRVATAIASALVFWQTAAQPPPRLLPAPVAPTPALSTDPQTKPPVATPTAGAMKP